MAIAAPEFEYLRKLMRDRCAIIIDPGKEYLAECRLAPLVGAGGYASVQHLLRTLQSQAFSGMHRQVLDAMTNNETWFFRDCIPFQLLKEMILPTLLQRRSGERSIRLWSAACSSGQEPYSLAMLLRENFGLPTWKYTIDATDVSSAILERAKRARYSQLEINRGLPAHFLTKYFDRVALDWEIKLEVRKMVTFQSMNLAEAWPPMAPFDVILLRNVLIYFDLDTRKQILARVRRVLRPDGYLLLGGAETTLNLDENFERVRFNQMSYYRLRG